MTQPLAPHDAGTTTSNGALVASDIHHAYADHVVLDGITLVAAPERRFGLVGDNGSGKSTLLRILAGLEHPTSGAVERPPGTALLEQELPFPPETTIGEVVESALAELRALTRLVAELSDLVQRIPDDAALAREYGDALEAAQDRQAWDADHRVDRVMRGLGLTRFPRTRAIGELSGGERARVAMAALLVRQPRALLLDEPTNHLDDDGLAFLERHLSGLPGVLVVSSHDRDFLDAVCTDLLDIDPSRTGATRFHGRFSDYLAARASARHGWERAWRDQQLELEALRTTVLGGAAESVARGRAPSDNDKFIHAFKGGRVQKAIARRVRDARRRLDDLERRAIAKPPEPLRFGAVLGRSADFDEPLFQLQGIGVEGRLAPLDLVLEQHEHLLVTGANGAGKSSLLAVLAGELTPTTGTLTQLEGMRVGLLHQDTVFADRDATPAALYRAAVRHNPSAPSLADLGLLREHDLERAVAVLSEGQRRRVALAVLVARSPELLLLDEPTNHLSPALVTDLEAAVAVAPCAVVVASHDRWLRKRWSARTLHVG